MKISRNHLRLLILEEINKSQSSGKVFFGWKDVIPDVIGIPGFLELDLSGLPDRHGFIRLERDGPLPSWWPASDNIISLSGFSQNYDDVKISGSIASFTDLLGLNWGRLVKDINWGQDVKGNESGDIELPAPPGMTMDDFQRRIVSAFKAYGQGDTYQPFPARSDDRSSRNSNSLAFSILRRAIGRAAGGFLSGLGIDRRLYPGSNKQVSGL